MLTLKERIILERNLDFMQFQNLCIVTFCCLITLFAMMYSLPFNQSVLFKIGLLGFSFLFILILFTKKGLLIENKKLSTGIFLFSHLVYKKEINSAFQILSIFKGKLSTNYSYSYHIKEFHNWEPDLNVSVESFTLYLMSENHREKIKIITLTKRDKSKEALDFITKNTSFKYEVFNPTFN